ncbi:hypothetical protein NST07_25870 [Paenibacillus sp. FSL L8-0340]|uniref:hypothetical protein n=1 Tax=Paenibacillus sp. FSL L8-0340 TaxID=2954685 RepID=UPI0031596858
MSQLYVIESIRNLDGTAHEREAQRKGQRVEILNCTVGQALLLVYRDDYNKLLRTSPVTNVLAGASELVVWTQNSEYTFRKAVA